MPGSSLLILHGPNGELGGGGEEAQYGVATTTENLEIFERRNKIKVTRKFSYLQDCFSIFQLALETQSESETTTSRKSEKTDRFAEKESTEEVMTVMLILNEPQ